jgi:hypothetical protein
MQIERVKKRRRYVERWRPCFGRGRGGGTKKKTSDVVASLDMTRVVASHRDFPADHVIDLAHEGASNV